MTRFWYGYLVQLVSGGADRILRLWDVSKLTDAKLKNAPQPTLKFEGHTLDIFCVRYSPDGEMIASGGGDLLVRLWDRRDGSCKGTLRGHTHAVTGVAWSLDNEQLITGSQDRTVRVWDAATFGHRRTFIGHTHWVRAQCSVWLGIRLHAVFACTWCSILCGIPLSSGMSQYDLAGRRPCFMFHRSLLVQCNYGLLEITGVSAGCQ